MEATDSQAGTRPAALGDERWRWHAERDRLLAEAHARPYVPVSAPMLAMRVATLAGEDGAEADRAHLSRLCQELGEPAPSQGATWLALEAPGWRLRWERHTEFSTWTFFRAPRGETLFAESALDGVPAEWIAKLPGEVLVACRLELRARRALEAPAELFGSDAVGARLYGDVMSVFTDFSPAADGTTRFLLLGDTGDAGLSGRLVRSLLEIETYRLMALLAFPLAGEASREVKAIETEAGQLAGRLADEADPEQDRDLLARLATLAGHAEALSARTGFRFAAARAYHDIVRDRIATLREERISGLQTIGEFMERRLAPAMRTCDSVAARELSVIDRIARTGQMLNTRVEVASEAASVALLRSMDARALAQLRLQRTVEGLSVAAISYYAVGLLAYLLAGIARIVPGIDPPVVTGLLVLPVVLTVWLLLRALRRRLEAEPAD